MAWWLWGLIGWVVAALMLCGGMWLVAMFTPFVVIEPRRRQDRGE